MSEDMNKNDIDDVSETSSETTAEENNAVELNEESTEGVTQTIGEEISENIADEIPVVSDSAEAAAEKAFSSYSDENPKNGSKVAFVIIGIVAALIIVALVVFGVMFSNVKKSNDTLNLSETLERTIHYNKYNNLGYINVSGRDLEQVAEDAGKSVDEFKTEYGLPEDMKPNTDESAAYYMMPVSKMAEMNGLTVDQVKEMLKITDIEITDSTPWGEVEGEVTLANYIGEEQLDSFKAFYGLGEEVTADTKWKEVRNVVDKKALEERLAEEAETENKESTEGAENTESTENTETSAESSNN